MKRQSKPLTPKEALARAATLCDRCEQCTPDLRRKMAGWGLGASDTERVIGRLSQLGYVDDLRYARAYAHDKLLFSGWGRNKILLGLRAKRIDREYISQAFDKISDEEYISAATRVIRTKIRMSKDGLSTYESRLRILKFAMQRGFETRIASDIIRRLKDEPADEMDS